MLGQVSPQPYSNGVVCRFYHNQGVVFGVLGQVSPQPYSDGATCDLCHMWGVMFDVVRLGLAHLLGRVHHLGHARVQLDVLVGQIGLLSLLACLMNVILILGYSGHCPGTAGTWGAPSL